MNRIEYEDFENTLIHGLGGRQMAALPRGCGKSTFVRKRIATRKEGETVVLVLPSEQMIALAMRELREEGIVVDTFSTPHAYQLKTKDRARVYLTSYTGFIRTKDMWGALGPDDIILEELASAKEDDAQEAVRLAEEYTDNHHCRLLIIGTPPELDPKNLAYFHRLWHSRDFYKKFNYPLRELNVRDAIRAKSYARAVDNKEIRMPVYLAECEAMVCESISAT